MGFVIRNQQGLFESIFYDISDWLFSDISDCRMEMSVIAVITTQTSFQPTSISATRHVVVTVMKRVVDHGE